MSRSRYPNSAIGAIGEGVEVNIDRVGPQNDLIVSQLHGKYTEQTRSKHVYHAASQAATTTTVALATTYTGLCLSNPAASGKNLIPLMFSAALSVAPAGIAPMAVMAGYLAAGVTTHTTPLTIYNGFLADATAAVGKADAACTLVGSGSGAPHVVMPFLGGFTAGALFGTSPAICELHGSIIIPPGGWVAIYTLTVAVGLFGVIWEEVSE